MTRILPPTCNVWVDFGTMLSETKESLRKEFLDTEVPPDETIVGMQRSMLRTLGFAPDHGVACLNKFSEDFPDNEKLQRRLHQFMQW